MENQENGAASQSGKTHERSASYPGFTLDKSISFTEEVYKHFSATTWVKREEMATVLKMHPNSVARAFAAATAYGLLEKSTDGYKVTALFNDIFRPENAKEKKVKTMMAFGSPKLNQDLIEKFDGHVIPSEFPNTLVKHHKITLGAAEDAANIFLESGRFAGVIGENRVLRYKDALTALQKMQYAEVYEETDDQESGSTESSATSKNVQVFVPSNEYKIPNLSADFKNVPIHLTMDKVAYFAYPNSMSEKDVKLVEHQLQGILMRIKFENEEATNKEQ